MKRNIPRLLALLLIIPVASACDGPNIGPTPPPINSPTLTTPPSSTATSGASHTSLLASGVDVGLAHPIAYGHTVFWPRFELGTSIYGYDIDAGRYFTVTEEGSIKTSIVSNGQVVAWVEGDSEGGNTAVRLHDLSTGKESLPLGSQQVATGMDTSGISLDGNTLYYEANGIYMYNLATGANTPVGLGRNPIAADGIVVWGQAQPTTPVPTVTPIPTPVPSAPAPVEEEHSFIGSPFTRDLHMAKANGSLKEMIIGIAAVGGGGSCGSEMAEFSISGERIARTPTFLAAGAITIYDVLTGRSEAIVHNATVSRPVLQGDILVWTEGPGGSNGPSGWSIRAHNLVTGAEWTVVPEQDSTMQESWAIASDKVIYTVGSYNDNQVDLYMTDLQPGK